MNKKKIYVFLGKLGRERLIGEYTDEVVELGIYPNKGDLIHLSNNDENGIEDGILYVVKQCLLDYVHSEVSLFVEEYTWEE